MSRAGDRSLPACSAEEWERRQAHRRAGARSAPAASEEDWQRRLAHRTTGVVAVKDTTIYLDCLRLDETLGGAVRVRPTTPDPSDRSISKRNWEQGMMAWRRSLAVFAGSATRHWLVDPALPSGDHHARDASLVFALAALGFPSAHVPDGPLWVLRDGNSLLAPHARRLVPANLRTLVDGDYLIATPTLFIPLRVAGSRPWRLAGEDAAARADAAVMQDLAALRLFRIVLSERPVPAGQSVASEAAAPSLCMASAAAAPRLPSCVQSLVPAVSPWVSAEAIFSALPDFGEDGFAVWPATAQAIYAALP